MDERILSLLRRKRQGLSLQNIYKELKVLRKERAKLHSHLKSLENRRIIRRVKNRFLLPLHSEVIKGKFLTSGRGYGFVVPEGGATEDIFIPARYSKGAVQGDVVEVLFKEIGKKGKPEGRILRVIQKARKTLIGVYVERNRQPLFLPFDAPSPEEIALSSKGGASPLPGMIIAVDRTSLRLIKIFGFPDTPGIDTQVIIQRYGLAESFSKETISETEEVSPVISAQDRAGREDYRRWTAMTIDGENAQDFDDAVSIKRLANGNYLLGVHIADVSHYVKPGSSLDNEAFERGTSVYFPGRTLPMLPEKLSNDMCSLRPRQERLTFSVLLEIDGTGQVLKAKFLPSIIRTAERMTYTSVQKILEGDMEERQNYSSLVPDLLLMRELAGLLKNKKMSEGSLDFDLIEPELVYKEGRLHSVTSLIRNEAHRIIEEFMVAANEAVASFLIRRHAPSIYRIHPPPALADLEKLQEMLAPLGIFLPKSSRVVSKDLQQAIQKVEGKPFEKFVNIQVLRALKLACYSEENHGHYGLAKKEYTHFTSPIRRYPDLVVHRILKQAIKGRTAELSLLASAARHSSQQERKADEAEKNLMEWRIYRFLKSKMGEDFMGLVVDMNRAGLVVELDDYLVEGMLFYQDLGGDFYKRSKGKVTRKRTGKKIELGERLRVTLASVDPVLRRMTLVLSGDRSAPHAI